MKATGLSGPSRAASSRCHEGVTVTTPAGNGGAPVLTLVPPGFDPSKPATVQTHFHGDHTSVAAPAPIRTRRPPVLWPLATNTQPSGPINSRYGPWTMSLDLKASRQQIRGALLRILSSSKGGQLLAPHLDGERDLVARREDLRLPAGKLHVGLDQLRVRAAGQRAVAGLFLEALGARAVPVVSGLPAGHGSPNRALPFGVPATLDADRITTLTGLSPVALAANDASLGWHGNALLVNSE